MPAVHKAAEPDRETEAAVEHFVHLTSSEPEPQPVQFVDLTPAGESAPKKRDHNPLIGTGGAGILQQSRLWDSWH